MTGTSTPMGATPDPGKSDTLRNCTLTANSATTSGGGVFSNASYGTVVLDNDILYGDTAPRNNEADSSGGTVFADYSDIDQSNPLTGTAGVIDADPHFANAPYDVTLSAGSPCIGTGDPAQAGTRDINGVVRFNPPTMGAHEGYSLVVTNTNAAGSGSLSGVLLTAQSAPDAVITFDPYFFGSFMTITPSALLELSQPVEIIGPAAGVAVSGGGSHGVFQVDSGVPAILTGLTLTGGSAASGGGLNNLGGKATLTGCTLTGNNASVGGGLYNRDSGTATLTDCTLTGNTAGNGGGLFNIGNGGNGSTTLTLTDCTLTGNSASVGGGLFNEDGGTATLTDCILTGNTGTFGGGGVGNGTTGNPTLALTDCTLTGNRAPEGPGGGLENFAGKVTLDSDILYGDTAASSNEISGSVVVGFCDIGQSGFADAIDIDADPLFVNAPGNLQLQPNSPCIGKGDPSQAGTYDILGTLRPNPPSIGAYEGTPAATRTRIMRSSSSSSLYGQSVTFTATVDNISDGSRTFPTGSVEFYVNGIPAATVSLTKVGGVATAVFTTSSLAGGTDYITASLLGNTQFASSSSDPYPHDVVPVSTSTVVTSYDNPTTVGEQASIFVQVVNTSPNSSVVPTGSVAFYLNGSTTPFDTEPLGSQSAGYTVSTYVFTNPGTDTITAKYLGNSDFTASTGSMQFTVNLPQLSVYALSPVTAGQPFQARVSEFDAGNNPYTSPGTVTVTSTDPRAVLPAPVTLTNGTATVTITDYTAGSQTLTVSNSGATPGTTAITVSSDPQAAPNISVNNVVLTRTSSTTVTASFTLVNTGVGAASAVKVTVAKLGTVSAAGLPAPVSIGAGQSQACSLSFTGVPPGATTLTLNGTYTGTPKGASTGYAFSGGKRVTVP